MSKQLSYKQKLFKNNITSIEIGTHNYCNRTCNFCPLSRDDVNRKEKNNTQFMDKILFQNILETFYINRNCFNYILFAYSYIKY